MQSLLEKIAEDRNGSVKMRSIGGLGQPTTKRKRKDAAIEWQIATTVQNAIDRREIARQMYGDISASVKRSL